MKICSKPCNDCPFVKTSLKGWLGPYSGPQELHNLVMSEKPFPCHLSHEEIDVEWNEVGEEFPYCKGALGYMRKAFKIPRNPVLAKLVKEINKEELENILS